MLYTVDGSQIFTADELYAKIGQELKFPDYFGKNLDALEECLRDKCREGGAMVIRIQHEANLNKLAVWPGVRQVFEENGIKLIV